MNFMTTLKASAVALALPVAAQAATLTSGFNYDMAVLTPVANAYSVDFETGGKTWDIGTISFTANGAWNDIQLVTITFSNDPTVYSLWEQGSGTTATLAADGFTTSSDFTISYTYAAGGKGLVLTTATFEASELPAVPVPAAGILLMSAVAGFGVVARRRNKA
ncbi:MAG TPA: VPLPA-CTERM sorting domain-containing protein [Paenirhodobacter sp.]